MQASAGDDARFLAGGQSLVPMMALRLAAPSDLIDLNTVTELSGIAHSGDGITIGAMTRQEDLAADDEFCRQVPVLRAVVDSVGHPGTRTRGTIGGSVCHADPAAELPALLLALDAEVIVASAAEPPRRLPIEAFFGGFFETILGPNELLREILIPVADQRRMGFHEITFRSADFAAAGAIVSARDEPDRLASLRVVVFGLGDRPSRLREVEAAVAESDGSGAALRSAAALTHDLISPPDEAHLSASYRRRLGVTAVRRALESALRGNQ